MPPRMPRRWALAKLALAVLTFAGLVLIAPARVQAGGPASVHVLAADPSGKGSITAAHADEPTRRSETPNPAVRIYLPLVRWNWDPRLDLRGTVVIQAQVQPGQGYWRLVKAVWYAEGEPPFAGQHHILVDTLDPSGARQPGVPIDITSLDGNTRFATITTELKPGELYAANFPMYVPAPAFRAIPADGSPADAVSGMGLGSIELPAYTVHTSYGLTWQWTIAGSGRGPQ